MVSGRARVRPSLDMLLLHAHMAGVALCTASSAPEPTLRRSLVRSSRRTQVVRGETNTAWALMKLDILMDTGCRIIAHDLTREGLVSQGNPPGAFLDHEHRSDFWRIMKGVCAMHETLFGNESVVLRVGIEDGIFYPVTVPINAFLHPTQHHTVCAMETQQFLDSSWVMSKDDYGPILEGIGRYEGRAAASHGRVKLSADVLLYELVCCAYPAAKTFCFALSNINAGGRKKVKSPRDTLFASPRSALFTAATSVLYQIIVTFSLFDLSAAVSVLMCLITCTDTFKDHIARPVLSALMRADPVFVGIIAVVCCVRDCAVDLEWLIRFNFGDLDASQQTRERDIITTVGIEAWTAIVATSLAVCAAKHASDCADYLRGMTRATLRITFNTVRFDRAMESST